MFGFQPIPTASYPWRFINWIFPPPPPPPCNNIVDCNNYSLEWATIPTIDIIKNSPAGYSGLNLWPYLYTSVANNTYPSFCINFSLEDGFLPPGLALDPIGGFIWGSVGCGSAGEYTVTIGARPSACSNTPTTTTITFNYFCPAAMWNTDPIVFYGTVGNQISYNLATYASSKWCTQNYYYYGDGGSWSQNGSIVTTTFSSADTYTSSATVDNNCQNVSSNTVGIIYYIT